jgi:hypothetical protein
MLLSIAARIPATMPLVPLFDTSASPDASHRVTAPGGYESWRTIAYDQKQDALLLSTRHEGALSDPAYIKAVRRYLRSPTRTLPPQPQNFVCHETALYSRGRPVLNCFIRGESSLESTFNLNPLPPISTFIQPTLNSSHHWILSNPLLHLRGQVAGLNLDAFAIRDQRFGTCLPNVPRWIDGAVFHHESALLFQATSTTSWIVEVTSSAIAVIDQPLTINSYSRGPWRIPYPREINLAGRAMLANPRIIDQSPFRLRLLYGNAFCEITLPPRLASPFWSLFLPHINSSSTPPAGKSSPSHP